MTQVNSSTRRRGALALTVAAALAISFAGGTAGAAGEVARVKAAVDRNKWKPVHTYIGKGTKVVWINPAASERVHDVTSIGSNWSFSRVLDPGERAGRVFKKRGNFRFRCVRHSAMVDGKCQGMCGVIHVFAE